MSSNQEAVQSLTGSRLHMSKKSSSMPLFCFADVSTYTAPTEAAYLEEETCLHVHTHTHTTPHTRVHKDTQQCDIVGSVDTTNLCRVKDCIYTQIASNTPLPSSKSLCSLSRVVKGYSSTLHFRHKTHSVPYY